MQIHLKTLGCRLNEAEIESWASKFQEKGHKFTGPGLNYKAYASK